MPRHDATAAPTLRNLGRALRQGALAALLAASVVGGMPVQAQPGDDLAVQAREALRKKDKAALATLRAAANSAGHPLAQWVEYWELGNRLNEAQQGELEAFWARWPGTYVEDRLRNDWLLELGRRRDWANFRAEFPRFRMNDDREVTCYALLTQHQDGQDVRAAARAAWYAQRELDDGCQLLASTLAEAKVFTAEDLWPKARLALENNRPRAARAAAALISPHLGGVVGDLAENPVRFLTRHPLPAAASAHEVTLLALLRMASNDPDYAAGQLDSTWAGRLPLAHAATAWAHTAKQAALKQLPGAADYARRAWKTWDSANKPGVQPGWSDDLLAWHVRAALREGGNAPKRWALVARAIEAMSATEKHDAAWVYWKARATLALARPGPEGEAERAAAQQALGAIAKQLGFYGQLAAEELGGRLVLPPAPLPLTEAERAAPRALPGFTRALQLVALGLRNEGVREWNFTLRAMGERELLAAAQLACEREVWDRCINTSERTRTEIDVAQRYPLPYRDALLAKAREAGLDPAVVAGLVRQESRFVPDIRSAVGATGLMQLMPATARWTAKKIGLDYRAEMIGDREVNLALGSAYLKRVLDDFGGSLALATAAYNAGPGRPRKWREGGTVMEPAAWAESIPFNETRDYVKKVLSNSVVYAVLLAGTGPGTTNGMNATDGANGATTATTATTTTPTLKARLGAAIGPRDPSSANPDRELP